MMTLKYSGSFKKDLKRYKNNSKKITELGKVLHFLEETGMVPTEYDPHYLKGNYSKNVISYDLSGWAVTLNCLNKTSRQSPNQCYANGFSVPSRLSIVTL